MTRKNYDIAREMFIDGRSLQQIAEALDVPESTVRGWKSRHGWDTAGNINGMLQTLERRIDELSRAAPTPDNLRAMRAYGIEYRQYMLTQAKLRVYEPGKGGKTSDKDFNGKLSNRGRKSNADKNYLDPEVVQKLEQAHYERMYAHQKTWNDAANGLLGNNPYTGKPSRILNMDKSRQIGATDWKSHNSLVDRAVLKGINQNFLSASRAQALLFRGYIRDFVYQTTGVDLKGGGDASPLTIRTDYHPAVDLRFLSASSNSAQGPHGDTINDEYFWQRDFERLRRVSSAMATQKYYIQTYISTPSTINHPAYPFWTGEYRNKGKAAANQTLIDVSHEALRHGRHCEDGQWRQIVTLYDAIERGFDRVDVDLLKLEYSDEEFRNLFLCNFIDDSASVFTLEMIQKCMVDTLEIYDDEKHPQFGQRKRWLDFDPEAKRPYGNKEVWLGFDPSRTRDNSAVVIVSPPNDDYPKFRVLEKMQFHNLTFEYQALRIKELTERYNVRRIAIDTTGMGQGVYEKTKELVSGAKITAIHYSAESKAELVTRGVDIFHNRRIELDSGWADLAKAMMTIYQTAADGGTITYKARRTNTTGHADLAFALLHALSFEPLTGRRKRGRVA